MDNIKDIERGGTLSRFLTDKPIRTQPFGTNISGNRAYARAERIALATHLVTNHVAASEPVRESARQTALALLSDMLELRDEMRSADSLLARLLYADIRRLMSLIKVLSAAGHLSVANAETLCDALDELGVYVLSAERSPLSESALISKNELTDVGVPLAVEPPKHKRQKGHTKDNTIRELRASSDTSPRNHSRTEDVVSVLRAQGTIGIKDIAAHLPEYSEKMIQRELKNLTTAGKVKKSGSKRWSVYSLAPLAQ